jgi:hypothetical protein
MNSFDKELGRLRGMSKKYLKNCDLKNYQNGDGIAAHVIEKYGKLKKSEKDNQKAD